MNNMRKFFAILIFLSFNYLLAMEKDSSTKRPVSEEIISLDTTKKQKADISMISLIGSDEKEVKVSEDIARLSQTINDLLDLAREHDCQNSEINFNNIQGHHLNLLMKTLKVMHKKAGAQTTVLLQDTSYVNILRWTEVLKPYLRGDLRALQAAANALDLPLFVVIMNAKKEEHNSGLPYIFTGFKSEQPGHDKLPEITKLLSNDSHLQNLKQYILDTIEIDEPITQDISLRDQQPEYRGSVWPGNVKIFQKDLYLKQLDLHEEYRSIYPKRLIGSSDGKLIAYNFNKTVVIKSIETGREINVIDHAWIVNTKHDTTPWSRDNKCLACYISSFKDVIKIYNLETEQITIIILSEPLSEDDFDTWEFLWPDNSDYFITVKWPDAHITTKIWSIKTGKCIMNKVTPEGSSYEAVLGNRDQLVIRDTRNNKIIKTFNLARLFQVYEYLEKYFEQGISSCEEFMLFKKIEDARQHFTQYQLTQDEQEIFNNMCNENQAIGDAIRKLLTPYVIQSQATKLHTHLD